MLLLDSAVFVVTAKYVEVEMKNKIIARRKKLRFRYEDL